MLRVLRYVIKHKKLLILGTLCMLLVIGIDQISPLLQMILVDHIIIEGKAELFKYVILAMLILTVLKSAFGFIKEYTYDLIGVRVHTALKNELFKHMETFEFTYYDNMNTGELMSRINEDIENVWQTIGFGLRMFVENIFYFTFSAIIIFVLDWRLASICVAFMIPISFIAIKIEKLFGISYGKLSDQTAIINTTAQEDLSGMRLVKAFAREKYEINKFLKLNQKFYDINMEIADTEAKYMPLIEFLTNISSVAMIIFGGVFILKGNMSMGVLVAFSNYIWNLIWPMRQLGWLMGVLSRNQASAKKVFAILDRQTKVQSPSKNAYAPEKIEGDIIFNGVNFKYQDEKVLENINLTIPKGSKVAIMGTTGAGKSSLIQLLGRYYEAYEGDVLIDGVNVKDYDLNVLRRQMAIVPQDTFLFSDTIANNIRFSKQDATLEEIREVCKKACILEFIESLPEGFNTEIGERGLGLSGGQKQRLAIARALLRKAPLLILDDATSALDMETEHALLTSLYELENACTTFIIAHRISAVKNADLIVYLEDGKVKESGTHEALLKQKGCYYEVFCKQYEDFNTLEKRGVKIG
nr:ABC transporter ATP-binding protein [uncultured Cellulosilyticum sp.]